MTAPQGIKADPAALAAARSQYDSLAATLDSTQGVFGGAAFMQSSAVWGGLGASSFEILSNAIAGTYRRASAGMRAASEATGRLQSILEELIALWNIADREFKHVKAEYAATKARDAATENEYMAAEAQLQREQAAMTSYHAQIAAGNPAATPPPQTPGLAARVEQLQHESIALKAKMTDEQHEMERLIKAMLSLEERAGTAAGAYGEVMGQIEAEWPSPQDVVAPSGGGGISLGGILSAAINYATPVGWVGDVTGLYNAGNMTTSFFSGAAGAAGAAGSGLWTQLQADWDALRGKQNTPAEQRADANLNATADMIANPGSAVSAFEKGVSQHGISYELGQFGFMAGTAWATHELLPVNTGLAGTMLTNRVTGSVLRALDVRSVDLGQANVLDNVSWGGSGWTKYEYPAIQNLQVTKVFEKGVPQQLLVFANNEDDNSIVSSVIGTGSPPDMSVVSLHGNPTGATLSVQKLTTLLKEHGLTTKPVCLLSCRTGELPGATAYGQRLANAIGQPVVAPTDLYWPGERAVGHFDAGGFWVDASDPWRQYYPGGTP